MSVLEKLKGMMKGHQDQEHHVVGKAGDMVNEKTGNKYSSQVDTAQQKLDDQLGDQPPTDQP